MTESVFRIPARRLGTLIMAVATIALAVCAWFVMFSAFMFYDDEGYVLLSLRNFAEHGGLYGDVYSQYGPFPFVFYYIIHELGFPLTHTLGRFITLGAWTGVAISCTALVGFTTRNVTVRLLVLTSVFVYLWIMANEPAHPGGLIVFGTALLAAGGYHLIRSGNVSAWAILVGTGTGALLLTKVNVGTFLAFSAVAWTLLHHRNEHVRRWAPLLLGSLVVILPAALMRSLLTTPWVQTFAFTFASSAIAVLAVSSVAASPRTDWKTLGYGLVGALFTAALVLGVVLVRNSSPRDLLEGILFGPMRQPITFSLRYVWPSGMWIFVVFSLGLCTTALWLRHRRISQVHIAIAILRIIVAIGLVAEMVRFPDVDPVYAAFAFILPTIWLFVWPLAGENSNQSAARAWVGLLLMGQCLHPFPVPGSQIAWGTVLVVPLAALGAWEALRWLAHQSAFSWLASKMWAIALNMTLAGLSIAMGWKFVEMAQRYQGGQELAQPGAEMIRLPDGSAALFRLLTVNATAHADMLFSLPGMFSLNIWTGLPTPSHANVTHWFSLLDNSRQQEIIATLEGYPRACIIVDRGHVEFLKQRELAPRGILHDYIASNFEPAFAVDRFEFCVRRGRKIRPFLLADVLTRAESIGADVAAESTMLQFRTLLPLRHPVARVELLTAGIQFGLHEANARVEVAPANSQGNPIGSSKQQSWPFIIAGPSIISIYFDPTQHQIINPESTLVLRNASGEEMALARVGR